MPQNEIHVRLKLLEGLRFVAETPSGHALILDSSISDPQLAPSPTEVLIIAHAACTAMDVAAILRKMKQPLHGMEVHATAVRAPEHPKRILKVHLEYVAYGSVDPSKLERAIQLSIQRYCGVGATLQHGGVEITYSTRIEPLDQVS